MSDDFPLDDTEDVDTDGDGIGNNADTDDDGDGANDNIDDLPLNPNETSDRDGDGVGDNSDVFPDDETEWEDFDEDGVGDNSDAFPTQPQEWEDTDSDGTGNNADTDDDGDGIDDMNDEFPLDSTETTDTDGDGIGNNADTDDDGDGVLDLDEMTNGTNSLLADTDGDTYNDSIDPFPTDSDAWLDTDGDGLADTFPNLIGSHGAPYIANSSSYCYGEVLDSYYSSTCSISVSQHQILKIVISPGEMWYGYKTELYVNSQNIYTTGDNGKGTYYVNSTGGYSIYIKTSEYDSYQTFDGQLFDATAYPPNMTNAGTQIDFDDDNDGVNDIEDDFPLNSAEHTDTDGDGIGNNADTDDDGDGVLDSNDEFPLDSTESTDTDGDGVGDNADDFPNDSSETTDTDNDGVGDNADDFPYDASETTDTDNDGVGDNSDLNPNGNARIKFELTDLFADTSHSYDFGSAPDMYVYVSLDIGCDGSTDDSDYTITHYDSYNPSLSSGDILTFDIDDDASSVCYAIKLYDDDTTSDDMLDYVYGSGKYSNFQDTGLSSSFTRTCSYDNTGSSESLRAGFEMDVSIY